jgi:hypothetical protein
MKTVEEKKQYRRNQYLKHKDREKETRRKYLIKNREKVLEIQKKWNNKNFERRKNIILKNVYGITLQQYEKMFKEQNGKCGICGIHQDTLKKSLCVDHCHKTNKVRGLLCKNCNVALGFYEKYDKNYFEKYLNKHKEKLN